MDVLIFVVFGLFEAITSPPVIALEVASSWLESHPLAAISAVVVAACSWLVWHLGRIEVNISDETLP